MRETSGGADLEFVRLPLFERTSKGVLSGEDIRQLESELLENPEKGVVEDHTGGVRKVRAAVAGRGKSGSARVVYLYVRVRRTVYFIFTFPKNVQPSLSDAQKKTIRQLVLQLKQEGR